MRRLSEEEDVLIDDQRERKNLHQRRRRHLLCVCAAAFITIATVGGGLLYYYEWKHTHNSLFPPDGCKTEDSRNCTIDLVESIPENLTYPEGSPHHMSIYNAWLKMLRSAEHTVDIASFYWMLLGNDTESDDPSTWQGESIYKEIIAAHNRGVRIRIVQSQPSARFPNKDTIALAKLGIQVRSLDMDRLVGSGILHTKLWIADSKHFFSGSANTDWRSLTQVKELGHLTWDCSCVVTDVDKIFGVYWDMAEEGSKIPSDFSKSLRTKYNSGTPMNLTFNEVPATAYVSSSPAAFCPDDRTTDLSSIIQVIRSAQHSVSVAVMDYFPTTLYKNPNHYWPVLDDELRRAAYDRGVHVRLMASWWNHTRHQMPSYLASLAAINGTGAGTIEVGLFVVPSFTEAQREIPYARVNHNKYLVTDNAAYIGTSNWSGDYFMDTCGVGYIINQTNAILTGTPTQKTVQGQLQAVFDRDWNSVYVKTLDQF